MNRAREQRAFPADAHPSPPFFPWLELAGDEDLEHVPEQAGVTSCSAFLFDEVLPLGESLEFETED